jgi:hypothetical protein
VTTELDWPELLRKHNPILVIFPHEPHTCTRPGASQPGAAGWGDYHPCSVEFFMARAHLRPQPRWFDFSGLFQRSWRSLPRTGIASLKQKLDITDPANTTRWELDVADIPSQKPEQAWKTYSDLLKEKVDPYQTVVYGRWHRGASGIALQYWYLYLYNDFRNKHEGDWEMVTIELAADGSPRQIGISNHMSGFRRAWSQVSKEHDRPVVYLARGSHAGYFRYQPQGFNVVWGVHSRKAPGRAGLLGILMAWLPHLLTFLAWRDHPPADPILNPGVPEIQHGIRIDPKLVIMRDKPADPSSDSWWMRYRGIWGSSHPRIIGSIGVDSPWHQILQPMRWDDPVRWVRSLEEDEP